MGIKELAASPYHRVNRFSKKSLQNHIEGSETDSIERGLQYQYQRWGYNPEMLYGWKFHNERAMKFPRRFRFSTLWNFRFFKIAILDDLIYESYTVFLRGFSVGNAGSME